MPAELLPAEGNVVRIAGTLDFASVTALYRQTDALFTGREYLVLDGGAIDQGSSAGVALLLEWLAEAHRRGCTLVFRGLPESLLAVARLAGVEHLLTSD